MTNEKYLDESDQWIQKGVLKATKGSETIHNLHRQDPCESWILISWSVIKHSEDSDQI